MKLLLDSQTTDTEVGLLRGHLKHPLKLKTRIKISYYENVIDRARN